MNVTQPSAPRRFRIADTTDMVIAAFLCVTIVTAFLAASDAYQHWFIGPLMVCGTLIGADLVSWIRRRQLLFDPAGLFSVLGFHFFFVSPLLMVLWDYRMPYLEGQPDDWREWLGLMGLLNAVGIYLYRWARGFMRGKGELASAYRRLDNRQFPLVTTVSIVLCTLLQGYIYLRFGGISGFVDRYLNDREVWRNTGWMFVVAESAPILAMIALAVRLRKSRRRPSWGLVTVVLAAFFTIQLAFGALRGSRMNTVICLFWAAGIIHYWLRPMGRKLLLTGIAFLFVFMYFAAFYKIAGLQMFSAFEGTEERDLLSAKTRRTMDQVLVSDLSRCDIQAFVLYRLLQKRPYEYAQGRTYAGALALLVPEPLWVDRPPGKAKWTTEMESGIGSYTASSFHSSRVYGIAGELMLNFGILSAPAGLLLIGLLVGRLHRFLDTAHPKDCRLLLLPVMICFCLAALILDSDNLIYFLVKYAAIPSFIVLFASGSVELPGAARTERPVRRRYRGVCLPLTLPPPAEN